MIRALPGYEKCQASDIILNFFIARTLTAGTIRMDGLFKQIAHREYFLDGIGKLRIAIWFVQTFFPKKIFQRPFGIL